MAAFVCHPTWPAAYMKAKARNLPLFAAGRGLRPRQVLGGGRAGRQGRRQVFTGVAPERISKGAQDLLRRFRRAA
ncbi:hypothetical protein MASR1M66_21370 [Aminivibrio sp.]